MQYLPDEKTYLHLAEFLRAGGILEIGENRELGSFARLRIRNTTLKVVKMTYLDFEKLSTPQLLAIRQILVGGPLAVASDDLKVLKRENATLKREKQWRAIVESYGLEFDDPEYWLSFGTEDQLRWICRKLQTTKLATATTMRIPQLIAEPELDAKTIIRNSLRELKKWRMN